MLLTFKLKRKPVRELALLRKQKERELALLKEKKAREFFKKQKLKKLKT